MASKKLVKKDNPSAFKHWIGVDLLGRMARSLGVVYPALDSKAFLRLESKLEPLELKPRVRLVREELHRQLPQDYQQALPILLQSMRDGTLKGFDLWPYSDFIQHYGVQDLELSFSALKEMTPYFSSEFAIRPFLSRYPEQTFHLLLQCAQDPDPHVRRWASEGSRPRLPWGERLQALILDPSPTFEILEILKNDPELYVRKSVANHLNDIAKDHPMHVIQILARWNQESTGAKNETQKNRRWIMHHALRTLIKEGCPAALEAMGVKPSVQVEVSKFQCGPKKIQVGETLALSCRIRLREKKAQVLIIDYVMHFKKANGKTTPKVFKLKKVWLSPGEEIFLQKKHVLCQVTTRTFYPGRHALELQINGHIVARSEWSLEMK